MTKEEIEFLFTILTGLATTGTFLFHLFDRRPGCKTQLRIRESSRSVQTKTGAWINSPSPEIFLAITNIGRVELFIATVWIKSDNFKKPYYFRFNHVNRSATSAGFTLSPKRRTAQTVFLSDILQDTWQEGSKMPRLKIQAEIVLETGKRIHSKTLSIPAELLEAASKESLIQS